VAEKQDISFITERDKQVLRAIIRGLKFMIGLFEKIEKGERV
jgi:hypothetical protein